MMSNYADFDEHEEVHVDEDDQGREIPCTRCRGRGWVLVHDQETDCIDCEGYGSVIVY